jgi:hypothetical protein
MRTDNPGVEETTDKGENAVRDDLSKYRIVTENGDS